MRKKKMQEKHFCLDHCINPEELGLADIYKYHPTPINSVCFAGVAVEATL
jgi:hypothetical protein